jgi:GNAT superfamily N-acetyltransferase
MSNVHAKFQSVWTAFGDRLGGTVVNTPAIDYVCSRTSVAFFNVGFLKRLTPTPDTLQEDVRSLDDIALAQEFPTFLGVTHTYLAQGMDAAAILEPLGWHPAFAITEMEAQEIVPTGRPSPFSRIERTESQQNRTLLCDINCHAYGIAPEAMHGIVDTPAFLPPGSHGYIGYFGEVAAATCLAFPHQGQEYLALVATLPEQKRRGAAIAIVEHAFREAMRESGNRRALLHATDAGAPVYEKLGFVRGERFTLFAKG